MNNPDSPKATYTFEEVIDRIGNASDRQELYLLCSLVREEKHEYSLFHLGLIVEAFRLKRGYLNERKM